MTEPLLELAPYELPPEGNRRFDYEPFFFEADCFGFPLTFVGRNINVDGGTNILFFGLPDEPQRGHFVCAYPTEDTVHPYMQIGEGGEIVALVESIAVEKWGRYFVLNESFEPATENDAKYTLFLCTTGRGQLNSLDHSCARFRWSPPCAREVWDAPPFELLERVLNLKDVPGEVGFAFSWAQLDHWAIDCFESAFPLQRGTYEEWKIGCKLCAAALTSWDKVRSNELRFEFRVSGKVVIAELRELGWWGSQYTLEEDQMHRFARWLRDYFSPVRNEELCARYSCVNEWATNPRHTEYSFTRPTQHERLEALLQLREWLADKATPDEIEALLNED